MERRNSEAEKKSREKKGKKDLASVGFQVWHTLNHWNFFMTAGSDAYHYPTSPEIPQGTRNLHVVWFHCLNRNLWSQIDNNQTRNGDIAMKCHMESGELMSGCSCQETGKSRRGLTVFFLFLTWIVMITSYMLACTSKANTSLNQVVSTILLLSINCTSSPTKTAFFFTVFYWKCLLMCTRQTEGNVRHFHMHIKRCYIHFWWDCRTVFVEEVQIRANMSYKCYPSYAGHF